MKPFDASHNSVERNLFVAWVPFQRRSLSMQSYFNYQLKFFSFAFKNRLLRPLEYILKSYQTIIFFVSNAPDVIWIQLPPNFLLHIAYVYKLVVNRKVVIIADSHNATFRKPWVKIPGTVFLLNLCDLVIIHNSSVKQQALDNGINLEKICVLEDPVAVIQTVEEEDKMLTSPIIVCPCSFNPDEPIAELLVAAKLMPEITIVITGNSDRASGIHDLSSIPDNVKLTGFVSIEDFDCLISNADAILGLTKLDGIQLSVANEALGAEKPMILARTKTLINLFPKGAVYVEPLQPDSIAKGCREAIKRKYEFSKEVKELCRDKKVAWKQKALMIKEVIAR